MSEPRKAWFISRLFDFSFSQFIATTLIRILYVLLMIAGLAGIAFGVFMLFQMGDQNMAILAAALSPIGYLVYLIVIRLVCETLIVAFAIAEDMESVRRILKEQTETE